MFVGEVIGLIFTVAGAVTTTGIVLPTALFITGMAFTFSNSFAGAFTALPGNLAGAAGALMAFMQTFGGGIANAINSFPGSEEAIAMCLAFLIMGTCSLMSITFSLRKRS